MGEILFSVLIPSVPSRLAKLGALFAKLSAQAANEPVEILAMLDNKQRTVGLKRDALVQSALGEYLAFVDDDDDVSDDYLQQILRVIRRERSCMSVALPDVIVFKQQCTFVNAKCISCLEIDGPPFTIDHDIDHPMEMVHQYPDGTWRNIKRKPWHHNAWRSSFAKEFHFPDKSFGEDGMWVEQMWPNIRRQVKIDATLHRYRFNGKTTEAS